ncbi:MAG: hypothetical protein E7271_08420 [Lachnospiraceae bacterium]|jgi:hypothetical protein|nr:hypothetical protein [Lachnospiraceae bacterium]
MDKKKSKLFQYCLVFVVFFAIEIIVEHSHLIESSVKDDLYFMSYFCNTGFLNAVFMHGYKFRPLATGMMWLVANISNGNIFIAGYFNLLFNCICAFFIYILSLRYLNINKWVSCFVSILYIVSHFSYYQITNQIGITETMATFFGICFIFSLVNYLQTSNNNIVAVLSMYFLCSMSHERYVALMPVIIIAVILAHANNKQERKKCVIEIFSILLVFAFIMVMFKLLVNNIMTGSGGTNVTETFSVKQQLYNLKRAISYLFFYNSQDTWLSMIGWNDYSQKAKLVVYSSWIAIAVIIIISIVELIRMENDKRKQSIAVIVVFILCIGATVAISSTTIRVELRWMYYPYLVAVLLLAYLSFITGNKTLLLIKKGCLYVYLLLACAFSCYCRRYYCNLYYWRTYNVANSLGELTFKEYGEEMYDKSWIVITKEVVDNTYDELLIQYDPYGKHTLDLQVVEQISDLYSIDDLNNKEILFYDEKKGKFINISEAIHGLGINYRD